MIQGIRPTSPRASFHRPISPAGSWPRRTSAIRSTDDGAVSEVYPALARVPPDLFGICVVATHGAVFAVGDAEIEFTIMSVSKPFVFALVCEPRADEARAQLLGVNSTGLPFNSLMAVDRTSPTDERTRW